jgi:DNA repair protein RadC
MEQTMQQQDWTKVSEVELVYKTKIKNSERPIVKSVHDSYRLLKQIWNENTMDFQEEFKMILLNRSHRVVGIYELSSGGITGTVADPRLILAAAIKSLSTCIILSHNHPSGNLKPSRADIELTQKIKVAARYHDIQVHDHIIISSEGYFSFANEGLL